MANPQLVDRVLHQILLLVARVRVDDGEAVHVVAEDTLRDADQRVRIDAAAHAERQRHVGAQPQLDRADQPLARAGHRLVVRHLLVGAGTPGASSVLGLGTIGRQHEGRARTQLPHALEERVAALVERLVAVDEIPVQVIGVDGQSAGRAAPR